MIPKPNRQYVCTSPLGQLATHRSATHRRHVAARWLKLDDFVYTWHCLLAEMKVVLVSVDKTLLGPHSNAALSAQLRTAAVLAY